MKIGITVAKSKTQIFLNQAYVDYVKSAGFEPVLINEFNDTLAMADYCDGLLLPGGIDLEPTYYGEDNDAAMQCDPERDNFERKVYQAFIMRGKKVFGICRGFQLMIREFLVHHEVKNADFYQHIGNHSLASSRSVKRSTPTHSVHANTKALYNVKGHVDMFVNSMHHQAFLSKTVVNEVYENGNSIKEIAITNYGLKATDKEHIVEAVDILIDNCMIRGVQWHPEELNDVALLQTFFSENEKVFKHDEGQN